MDPAVREAVLRDPRVQEAVKSAGRDALANPEVQRQILETCKQKFPEIASAAQAKIRDWAKDPEVQRQAYACAGLAAECTQRAVGQLAGLIQQGPAGLRVLAFAGGAACCVNAALFLFGVLNPANAVSHMVGYVLHGYLIAFALTTMLFEAKPEWIAMASGLDVYQNMLLEKAEFLSEVLGRGLFYGFQGTLWLSFASFSALQNFALGIWLLLVAMLHIFMHFGVMPHEVVSKLQMRDAGYMPLAKDEEACQHLLDSPPCAEEAQAPVLGASLEVPSAREVSRRTPREEPPQPSQSPRPSSARRPAEPSWPKKGPPPADAAEEQLLRSLQVKADKGAEEEPAQFMPVLGRWNKEEEEEDAEVSEVLDTRKKTCCSVQ